MKRSNGNLIAINPQHVVLVEDVSYNDEIDANTIVETRNDDRIRVKGSFGDVLSSMNGMLDEPKPVKVSI
jgi:hypothetical protein